MVLTVLSSLLSERKVSEKVKGVETHVFTLINYKINLNKVDMFEKEKTKSRAWLNSDETGAL